MNKQIFWIASFPKSGNTLIRSLLASLFFTNDGILDLKLLNEQAARVKRWCEQAIESIHDKDIREHYQSLCFVFSLSKLVDLCLSLNGNSK